MSNFAVDYAKTYASGRNAIEYLREKGFVWNESTQRFERGKPYVSLNRAYVGQCLNGQWLITRA